MKYPWKTVIGVVLAIITISLGCYLYYRLGWPDFVCKIIAGSGVLAMLYLNLIDHDGGPDDSGMF